ncbi:MAG: GAF domain-containing protein [Chthonomonadales bacterium]
MNPLQEQKFAEEYVLLAAALRRASQSPSAQAAAAVFLEALTEAGILTGTELRGTFVNGGSLRIGRAPQDTASEPPLVEALHFPWGLRGEVVLFPSRKLDGDFVAHMVMHLGLLLRHHLLHERCVELENTCSRRIEEVGAIYEIGRAMAGTDLSQILQTIARKAVEVLGGRNCAVMRLDRDTGDLSLEATASQPQASANGALPNSAEVSAVLPAMMQLARQVARSGEPVLLPDQTSAPPQHEGRDAQATGSAMLVPIRSDQRDLLGVLCICRDPGSTSFDRNDLRLFHILAGQAGLAITSAQLYSDLRRRVYELSFLSDVSRTISSVGNLDALLELVVDRLPSFAQVDRCCIYLFDRASRRYIPRALRGYRPEMPGAHSVRRGQGVIGVAAMKQIPIVEVDARNALQPIRGFARALGTNSFAAIPITAKGSAIGVLLVDNKFTGRTIGPDTVERLALFVDQVSVAVENAILHEDREHRFRELDRLATQTDNILRSIATAVAVVDAAGYVTRWNDAAAALWGIPAEEAISQDYNVLVRRLKLPPEEVDQLARAMSKVRDTGDPVREYQLRLHPEGRPELCVNMAVSPLTDRQGNRQGAVQATEDITDRITLEAEMARMSRLADIGKLAAKLAHELRNPLSPIKGAAQLIRKEYGHDANLNEFLDIIEEEVNTLNRITSELLDFARPLSLDLRPINLNDVIQKNLRFLAGYLSERRIACEFQPEASLPQIVADPRQMDQVIRNLAINAAQAMATGGRLSLATRYHPTRQAVAMEITDTGPGIPPEALDTIFQPFFTTKAKGAGLGLPIVRKIVETHGGNIAVHSLPGNGTTFVVSLPLAPPGVRTSTSTEGMAIVPDE